MKTIAASLFISILTVTISPLALGQDVQPLGTQGQWVLGMNLGRMLLPDQSPPDSATLPEHNAFLTLERAFKDRLLFGALLGGGRSTYMARPDFARVTEMHVEGGLSAGYVLARSERLSLTPRIATTLGRESIKGPGVVGGSDTRYSLRIDASAMVGVRVLPGVMVSFGPRLGWWREWSASQSGITLDPELAIAGTF